MIILEMSLEVKVTVTPKWYATLPSQDTSTHQLQNSYLKWYRRYGRDKRPDWKTDRQNQAYL